MTDPAGIPALQDAIRHLHGVEVAGDESDPDVEILKTFQGVEFADVFANSASHPSGFRIGAVNDARRWKVASGRPKDLKDVAAIDRFLSR
jgi:hypothetical protein